MYTRFKSQKSGMKLGLSTIANTSRARVLIPPPQSTSSSSTSSTVTTSPASSTPISSSNSTQNVNSTSSNNTFDPITTSAFLFNHSDQPIVLIDYNNNSNNVNNESETNVNEVGNFKTLKLKSVDSERIPFNENVNNINNKKSSNRRDKKANHSQSSMKSSSTEEIADLNCISYVKSTWEKYASEIGTQNGPLRHHVDENAQYPHLNGFVAFDMEHWWAERAISCMINEKPSKSLTSTTSNHTDSAQSSAANLTSSVVSMSNTYKNSSSSITGFEFTLPSTKNRLLSSSVITPLSISKTSTTNKSNFSSSITPSLQNFQLCFS